MELNEDLPFALQELRTTEIHTEGVLDKVASLIVDAVDSRVDEPVAIAFSGGVDSTVLALICEKLGKKFQLYAVGFEDSKDMVSAENVAKEMGWSLKKKVVSLEDVEKVLKKVVSITGKCDPITAGVGAVTYIVCSMAEEDLVMTGLGSEEIFAGYERHKGDINNACWEGLLDIWERDVKRDLAILQSFEKKGCLPFMDKELIEYGMAIDPSLKVKDEVKKYCLREAAVTLGLPRDIAFRKKCAAQYGSKIDWAIEKLAKKKGMKKKEYLAQVI